MKLFTKSLVYTLVIMTIFSVAYAQFTKPEDAVRYRKAVMVVIAQHFGAMGAVVKGQSALDKAEFARNAQLVQMLAALPWEAFTVAGSDKGDTDLKSSALKDQARFMTAADAFEDEAAMLVNIAEGGGIGEIKSQFGAVAKSCKDCHREYRK